MHVIFCYDFDEFMRYVSQINSSNTVFQQENWQRLLYEEFCKNILKRVTCVYFGAVLVLNGKPILAANFFLKKLGRHRGIYILGSGGETDYHDFIYDSNISVEMVDFFMRKLFKNEQKTIYLPQLLKGTIISKWAEVHSIKPKRVNECVHIPLFGAYEVYWANLRKNVRQNIRTAMNRLEKDKKESRLAIFKNRTLDDTLARTLEDVYEDRRIAKRQRGYKNRLSEHIRNILKSQYNIMLETKIRSKNSFTAVFYIESEIAAFCYGFVSNNNACIMQVAITEAYAKYSPGMLMLNEVIKNLYSDVSSDKPIYLDLTNGNESYKYQLGGQKHYTEYYVIEAHDLEN